MASPFSLFRKHQKIMMVVLVVCAVFAFTLDFLLSASGSNPVLFGMLVGAGMATVLGIRKGKGIEYAVGGMLIGGALGVIGPMIGGKAPIVVTNKAELSREDLQKLASRRVAANDFMNSVMESARTGFGGGQPFGPSDDRSLVYTQLLNYEADAMGIHVSDEMVRDYIGDMTSRLEGTKRRNQLEKDDLANALRRTKYLGNSLTWETLTREILAPELRAQLAQQLLRPRVAVTPDEYWRAFRKTSVTAELEATAIPVDAFMDLVEGEPSEGELQTLFEKFKTQFPNQTEPGSPGFRRDRRVSLSYIEVAANDLIESVPDPTDEEILAYYEANKESKYKIEKIDLPDGPAFPDLGTPPAPEGGVTPPPAPSGNPDKPAEPTGPATPNNETPDNKSDSNATTPAKPNGTEAPKAPAAPKPNDVDEKKESTESNESSCDEGEPTATAGNKADTDSKEATDSQPATPGPALKAPDAKTDESPSTTTKQPEAPETAPTSPTENPTSPTEPKEEAKPAPKSEEPEYQQLDDLLKGEIIEELRLEAAQKKAAELATEILTAMDRYSDLGIDIQTAERDKDEAALKDLQERSSQLEQDMKKLAEEKGVLYATTGLVTSTQFQDSIEYPLSAASEPGAGATGGTSAHQDAFGSSTHRFIPRIVATSNDEFHRYVYWLTEDEPAHVPQFTDEGIRDQVVKAWKTAKARELASARAEKLKAHIEAGLAAGLSTMDDAQSRQVDASKTLTVSSTDKIADVHKQVGNDIFSALNEDTTIGSYVLQQLGELPFNFDSPFLEDDDKDDKDGKPAVIPDDVPEKPSGEETPKTKEDAPSPKPIFPEPTTPTPDNSPKPAPSDSDESNSSDGCFDEEPAITGVENAPKSGDEPPPANTANPKPADSTDAPKPTQPANTEPKNGDGKPTAGTDKPEEKKPFDWKKVAGQEVVRPTFRVKIADDAEGETAQLTIEFFQVQTVTGEADAVELSSPATQSSVTWVDAFRHQVSSLNFVQTPGEDFMKAVFDEMAVDEIRVLPNADLSVYCVVRLKSKQSSDETELADLHEKFILNDPPSGTPYIGDRPFPQMRGRMGTTQSLAQSEFFTVDTEWRVALEAKYGVEWNQTESDK